MIVPPATSDAPLSELGLFGWLAATRVVLPLKLVECRFRVEGPFAHVEIDQVFRQTNSQPLDCRYTFPLPDAAAVHRCEMHVNERIVRARVEELEKARAEFAQAKAAGQRAALVETERPNLFTLQLGNLQPDDLIVIRLAYVQTLERVAGELRLRIPLAPGVRYIPGKPLLRSNRGPGTADDTDQTPDASRLTPPRIDALHPDAAIFALSGQVAAADVTPGSLSSPTHPILVSVGAEHLSVASADAGAVPDRDVVLRWDEREADQLETRLYLHPARAGGSLDYALLQLRPPATAAAAAGRGGENDFYFLLDRSGSMQGLKWTRACAALRGFVDRLAPADRVFVTLFESSHQDFAEAPLAAEVLRRDPNFRALERLGVAGGTELLPAAEHLFQKRARHSKGRRCIFVILTDGQVGNEAEVSDCFAGQPDVVVHTIGIDDAVNDSLLRRLARRHRGECWLVTPTEDITGVVSALGARLGRPVLADLRLAGTAWQTPDPSMSLPDLFAGQTREILLAAPAGSRPPVVSAGDGTRLAPVLHRTPNEAVRLAWVRARLEEFEAKGERDAALQLAIAHNVLCEGAAFIAFDEAEKVRVAAAELYQPSMVLAETVQFSYLRTSTSRIMAPSPMPLVAPACAPMMAPPPPSMPSASPGRMLESRRQRKREGGLLHRLTDFFSPEAEAEREVAQPVPDPLDAMTAAPGDAARLSAWLQESGLIAAAADALAPALLAWLAADSTRRDERLERLRDWREALRSSERKLALCLDFLAVDLAGMAEAVAAKKAIQQLRAAAV